jgi:hypothetical protein
MTRYRFTRTTRDALTILMAVLMISSVMAPAVAYSLSETNGTTTPDPGIETGGATNGAVTDESDGNAVTSNSSAVSAGVRELAVAAQSGADSELVTQSSDGTGSPSPSRPFRDGPARQPTPSRRAATSGPGLRARSRRHCRRVRSTLSRTHQPCLRSGDRTRSSVLTGV